MPERLGYSPPEKENLVTRVNYSGRVKGVFGAAIFGVAALAVGSFEQSSGYLLPPFFNGRSLDIMVIPAYASVSKIVVGDDFRLNLGVGLLAPTLTELAQKFRLCEGVAFCDGEYDTKDFIAYAIGGLGWLVFEGTAKALHDSGLTLPIYRALGIRHRLFD